MAESGALRTPRRARGVLDVDRIGGVERIGTNSQIVVGHQPSSVDQLRPVVGVEVDHLFETPKTGRNLLDHVTVSRGHVLSACYQEAAARLVQGVLEFVDPIRWVDVDLDCADLRGGVLDIGPFGKVGTPHTNPVPGLDADPHEAFGHFIDGGIKLSPGLPNPLMHHHESLPVGKTIYCGLEVGTDGLLEERSAGGTSGDGQSHCGSFPEGLVAEATQRAR